MKIGTFKGIHYVELESGETPDSIPFVWDGVSYEVGSVFDQLGSKPRSTLKLQEKMVYKGKFRTPFGPLVLFGSDDSIPQEMQLSMFPEEPRTIYVAPIYVDDDCLLMPSSRNGFWDIRP